MLGNVTQEFRRNRLFVAGIQIEIAACNDDVFRVRCFEDQQPAGLQHAQRFADDRSNLLEGHMLDNVKSRNKDVTTRIERGKVLDSVTLKCRQTSLPTRFEHIGIEIHTNRAEPCFDHQLQPFAATAAQIECLPARVERRERRNERLVFRQSTFDQFPCASMLIFERAIKAIHYGKLLTVVCSHSTPTKLAIPGRRGRGRPSRLSGLTLSMDAFRAQLTISTNIHGNMRTYRWMLYAKLLPTPDSRACMTRDKIIVDRGRPGPRPAGNPA
ncbi:hypothetical protein WJ58_14560 [Burkholderia ubonensis]|nr:hypothetical protein WJ58_14560 [Burkholderia ubonensis]